MKPKGLTVGGIAHLPNLPEADLHGLVRLCIRDVSFLEVCRRATQELGINLTGSCNLHVWQESKSHAEIQATEGNFGEFFVCSLVSQYLSASNYRPLRKKKSGTKEEPARTGTVPADWGRS